MDINSNPGILNLDIHFNNDGWGPVNGEKIPAFIGVPYAHFDKKDKIGRAAYFVQNNQNMRQQFQRRRNDDMATDFAYRHDTAEDNTFQLVDTATKAQGRNKHTAST